VWQNLRTEWLSKLRHDSPLVVYRLSPDVSEPTIGIAPLVEVVPEVAYLGAQTNPELNREIWTNAAKAFIQFVLEARHLFEQLGWYTLRRFLGHRFLAFDASQSGLSLQSGCSRRNKRVHSHKGLYRVFTLTGIKAESTA
jgi:hypothetical protein